MMFQPLTHLDKAKYWFEKSQDTDTHFSDSTAEIYTQYMWFNLFLREEEIQAVS